MEFHYYPGDFVIRVGVVVTFILALAFLIKSKKNHANLWAFGFFLSAGFMLLSKSLYNSGAIIDYPHFSRINYSLTFCRTVCLFLFFKALITGRYVRMNTILHFVPFLIVFFYLVPYYSKSTSDKVLFLESNMLEFSGYVPQWFSILEYVYGLLYVILVFSIFIRYNTSYAVFNRKQKSALKMIKALLGISLLYLVLLAGVYSFGFSNEFNFFSHEMLTLLTILFLILSLVALDPFEASLGSLSQSGSVQTDSASSDIMNDIDHLLSDGKLYKHPGLGLRDVAQKLDIPEYLISNIVRREMGCSFRDYLNKMRINEAKARLIGDHESFTIEGIAKDSGFKSRASFYNAFKKYMKMTPSQYIRSEVSNLSK